MRIVDQCHLIKKELWNLQIQIDQLHDLLDEIVDRELLKEEKKTDELLRTPASDNRLYEHILNIWEKAQ